MKAFKVIFKRLPGEIAYYADTTASKARYNALLDLQDGYDNVTFQEIVVTRAPSIDYLADIAEGPGSISDKLTLQDRRGIW
jgi:hypothetical protein